MSFDTNQKTELHEAAAKYIIRSLSSNERSILNFYQHEEIKAYFCFATAYFLILKALCNQVDKIKSFNNNYMHISSIIKNSFSETDTFSSSTQSFKDEPLTRDKLKIV
jgi:hypothetical protein